MIQNLSKVRKFSIISELSLTPIIIFDSEFSNFSENFPSSLLLSNFRQNFPTIAKLSNSRKTFQFQQNISNFARYFPTKTETFQLLFRSSISKVRKLSNFISMFLYIIQFPHIHQNCVITDIDTFNFESTFPRNKDESTHDDSSAQNNKSLRSRRKLKIFRPFFYIL